MQYNSDSPATIRDIFALEGDALRKAGFREPDTSLAPEGFIERSDTTTAAAAKPAGQVAMQAAQKN
jgi:hypothetical protein